MRSGSMSQVLPFTMIAPRRIHLTLGKPGVNGGQVRHANLNFELLRRAECPRDPSRVDIPRHRGKTPGSGERADMARLMQFPMMVATRVATKIVASSKATKSAG